MASGVYYLIYDNFLAQNYCGADVKYSSISSNFFCTQINLLRDKIDKLPD